jgi:hypothetical protein
LRLAGPLVSPDGRHRAEVRVAGGLEKIVISGRPVRGWPAWKPNVRNGSPGPIMLLGWSGDSRWVFYAIDPQGSASLLADGLLLDAISVEGDTRRVAPTLGGADYRTWCGGRLVLTAGYDRLAGHHKQLVTAKPSEWKVRPLVREPGRAWGSLACDGRSVVVQSTRDTGSNTSSTFVRWSLWRVGLDGSMRRLTSPPPGYADASPHVAGDAVFFVRSRAGVGRVYALRDGKLLGPFASLGFRTGFYGHTDWPYSVRR